MDSSGTLTLLLTLTMEGYGNTVLEIDNYLSCLRSKDFGSPNARKRCYIVGVRKNVCPIDLFDKMTDFIEFKCPSVHRRMNLVDCDPASLFRCFLFKCPPV